MTVDELANGNADWTKVANVEESYSLDSLWWLGGVSVVFLCNRKVVGFEGLI